MGVQRGSEPLPAGEIITDAKRHSMDGIIQSGDVVVSHVNGTRDCYIAGHRPIDRRGCDAAQRLTMLGGRRRKSGGYERLEAAQTVWLSGGVQEEVQRGAS